MSGAAPPGARAFFRMKPFFARLRIVCAGVLVAALGSGCTSLSVDRLKPRQHFETFAYTQDAVTAYQASKTVLEELGFQFDHGSETAGRLEMISRPLPGSGAQLQRQRRAVVSVSWTTEGTSLVEIGFWDESEDASSSGAVSASGQLIRGGALYDAFWQKLDGRLPPSSSLLPATPGTAGPGG